ncbi:MAG: hypothetical protein ACI857_002948 [Arenicella sp.]|jgi:hypothetical protein
MTFNGIGFRYLNASELDVQGCYTSDKWFTFLYLPIIPLKRMKMKRAITKSNNSQLEYIEESKIDGLSIFKSFVWGWIIYPVIILWPMPFMVIELYQSLGFPENLHSLFFASVIIYMLIMVWILADRYEEQGLPKNYKQVLKDQKKANQVADDK